ncbi:Protein PHLOEM PROTEIN 2-LIKE A10 [Striga hermonthica]|uniref:Protein PHLOEM PROTEIN 2-LIKE A10 n=1 Tax=Striga hermonthica TaxID=68872 RepID=A0A9N7RSL8_STRHE|nr:Protein PHLOEM PROTEIN 2-LIKE A10 [Striga hermonthica]
MELGLLGKKSLEQARRKRKWLAVMGALGFTVYGAYRFYNSPSVVQQRQKLTKLVNAFVSLAEMMSDSADAVGILSRDLKQFLGSESDQIPQSLKQVAKIARSDEFSESLTRFSRAATLGILRGFHHESLSSGEGTFLDKLFSEAGTGFASAVLGSFARNLVLALYLEWENENKNGKSNPRWVEVACEDKCRQLIGDCVRSIVSTAVAVYLDRTAHINTYDEIFSGLTNPKHEARVKDMLVTLCNNAVETFIRTSKNASNANSPRYNTSTYSRFDFEDGLSGDEKLKLISTTLHARRLRERNSEGGWSRKMCSAMAVPVNRKFVLDVTGLVTFEAVRSFLEFLLCRVAECMRKSMGAVHEEVFDKGVEVVRYVGSRSSAVTALCLTLCLNILNSPWILAHQ